ICRFGIRRKAIQTLCKHILLAAYSMPAFDCSTPKGRGAEVASDRVFQIAAQEHCSFFVLADIKNFFGSLEQETVGKMLPLPGPGGRNYLLITSPTPFDWHY